MKEKNEPVLFVNTFSVYRKEEKQVVKLHRLDDIKVLMNLNKEIEVEVECNNKILYGYIKEINKEDILIKIDNKDNTINLNNIKNIKIINTK